MCTVDSMIAVLRTFVPSFCAWALFAATPSALSAQSGATPTERYSPLTASTKRTDFFEQGGEMVFSGQFFRKSDGSYARVLETEAYDGERGTIRTTLDAPTRTWVWAESFIDAAIVMRRSDAQFRNLMGNEGGCRNDLEDADSKRIGDSEKLGVHVIEVERKLTDRLIVRRWVAPELQCFALLDLLIETGEVRTKDEVLSIQFGEPDPAAFRVPGGYKILDPLQFEEIWRQKYNGRDGFGDIRAQKLQREYEEGRAELATPAAK